MHNTVRLSKNKYRTPLRHTLFLLFFFSSFFMLRAQHTPLYFRHLTVEDGLSSNAIHCIMQDSAGFMWFGTDAGLERFDGYEFKTFQIEDSVNGNLKVLSILEDRDDARFFWLGTNRGVKKYYPLSDKIINQNLPSFNKKHIKKIIKDYTGLIWFRGINVLISYNPLTGKQRKYKTIICGTDSLTIKYVFDIFEDSRRQLWIGTLGGLAKYDRLNDYIVRIRSNYIRNKHNRNSKYSAIREDKDGNIWIGSMVEGLVKYDPKSKTFLSFSNGLYSLSYNSKDMLIDANGFIWMISDAGGGLTKFNPQKSFFEHYSYTNTTPNSLSANSLTCIFQDKQGTIWIGTKKNGIERFQANSAFFINYQNELSKSGVLFNSIIYGIFQDGPNDIWLSTNHNDLIKFNLYNGKMKKFNYWPELKKYTNSKFSTIHKINERFFVLGSRDFGLFRFNPVSGKFTSLLQNIPERKGNLSVFSGLRAKNGILWYGLITGEILRFNPITLSYVLYKTSKNKNTHNRVLRIFETENGNILAATHKSKLLKYNLSKDSFEEYYSIKGKNNINIYDLCEMPRNRIWMATNKGLYTFNTETDSLFHFMLKQGAFGNRLLCILPEESGKLWLSYNAGLIRFDPETQRGENYSYKDGIASISFRQGSSFKSDNGVLFFGGKNGFTMFKPDSNLKYKPASIMVTKSELYINNFNKNEKDLFKQNFAGNKRLKLPYNNYGFLFEFSLSDYISPFRSHYKYMLEGGAGRWQDLGSRHSISFVSLSPGKYKLHVKGQNAQGLWSTNEAVAEFEILPPFWQTWWFRLWMILILFLIVLLGYQIRVYAIRRRNAELEEINKKLNDQITTRRQIERMLTENEIKYRTLVEGIGDGIYTLNAAGIFHFMNQIAAARMGGKPSDFSGRSIYEYYSEAVVKPLMTLVNKVIKDGVSREIDAEIQINGTMKSFNVGIHPLKNERGEITLTLHIAVDTSERVKLEEQLRQAQKMEAVGNLAGGIAHDFNNLLSVIRGYSFLLLQEEELEDSIYKSIKEIDIAGERAQGLTRQLLAFSRKQMLKPKVMNLNTHINEFESLFSRLIPENIELKYELEPELNHIFADPGQMEQVIMNLIVNARDAMPAGGCLTIKTTNAKLPEKLVNMEEKDRNNTFIAVSVTDTGIGMTKEVQQKIFDPFFTTKETGKGTGLGLSTVFGIVKQSEGYVWVESVYKKGSTFFVYLPAVNKKVIAEETEEAKEDFPRGHETILVVEDEISVRKMIVKMLNLYGYTTLEANDGWNGLSIYEQNLDSVDLILSDVVMPGLSGVELAEKIHKINPKQKIIYMSGYTDDKIVQSGIVKRGIHFLQKPFTPEMLMGTLTELFSANNQV